MNKLDEIKNEMVEELTGLLGNDICYKKKLSPEMMENMVKHSIYDCNKCRGQPRACPNYISHREITNGGWW